MTLYPSRPPPPPNSQSSEHVNCSLTLLAYALFVFSTCGPRRLYATLAAFMRPSPPSCGRRRLHAAVASFVRPSPPSCGPRRLHAALAAFIRPSPPSCGPRRLYAAIAAFLRLSPPTAIAVFVRPLPHLSSQRSRRREAGHPLADALLILVPSLVLAGGTVEEQIDETDIRKILQIVWAESGSLTVPV